MPTDRIAFCYHFKLGNKIVQAGMTDDPDIRGYQLKQRPGWEKGHLVEKSVRTTVANALAWVRAEAAKGRRVEAKWLEEAAA